MRILHRRSASGRKLRFEITTPNADSRTRPCRLGVFYPGKSETTAPSTGIRLNSRACSLFYAPTETVSGKVLPPSMTT